MNPGNSWVTAALVFLVARTALAQGGPPFRTDDPDTPGNRQWEINLGLIGDRNAFQGSYALPNFDVNYGLGDRSRTSAFAWYTLAGSIATAAGSLCGGALGAVAYRPVVFLYASLGVALAFTFAGLSRAAEVSSREPSSGVATMKDLLGIQHSSNIVLKLSSLFALDAFAGGFVVQSFAA